MKRLFLCLFSALLMVGCATTYYDSDGKPISKETMAQLKAAAVKAHLGEHRYRIFMDRMEPMRGPSIYLQDDWGIEVSVILLVYSSLMWVGCTRFHTVGAVACPLFPLF